MIRKMINAKEEDIDEILRSRQAFWKTKMKVKFCSFKLLSLIILSSAECTVSNMLKNARE